MAVLYGDGRAAADDHAVRPGEEVADLGEQLGPHARVFQAGDAGLGRPGSGGRRLPALFLDGLDVPPLTAASPPQAARSRLSRKALRGRDGPVGLGIGRALRGHRRGSGSASMSPVIPRFSLISPLTRPLLRQDGLDHPVAAPPHFGRGGAGQSRERMPAAGAGVEADVDALGLVGAEIQRDPERLRQFHRALEGDLDPLLRAGSNSEYAAISVWRMRFRSSVRK